MSFELKEPVLVIGLGGVGSKLALDVKKSIQSGCLLISNDQNDLDLENSIKISTGGIINPSYQTIRGFGFDSAEKIRMAISDYSTVILMSNLAGKTGAALAPIVSSICKEEDKNVLSFAIMPFGYENDRIFASGTALNRVKRNSSSTIVVDNDAMLQSNPDLNVKTCYKIANSAILHIAESLNSNQIESDTHVLSTSKNDKDLEVSLRDSLKMLYEDAPPNSIKSSIIHVLGGDNIPVGMMKRISMLAQGTSSGSSVAMSSESDESGIVMLSTVQGQTKFDSYDPLSSIPMDKTLDWDMPDCSYDCKLDIPQLE